MKIGHQYIHSTKFISWRYKYPGAMSRWDNVSEICSMCGSAEAMSPLLNPDARMLMQASREFDDFDLWREGVLLGRPAVEEMQRASMEAAKKLKEMEME